MFDGGRVTVTFTSPKTGDHITVAAKSRRPDDSGKWVGSTLAESKVIFFEVPNDSGFGDKIGKYTDGKGFVPAASADPARVFCAKQLLALVQGQPLAAGLVAQEEERCGKCGRALTDPISIARGIGPECYGAMTGSTHQAKVKPESKPAADEKPAAVIVSTSTVEDDPDHGKVVVTRSEWKPADGKDKQGVSFGHGDWRARKAIVNETLKADRKKKSVEPAGGWSMNRIFPETGSPIPY
jgi:hypothetical protein